MKDPTIGQMRKAVQALEAIRALPFVPAIEEALELGITMARRYLAMVEEGPVGVVDRQGYFWRERNPDVDDQEFPRAAPHRYVYAHPTTTHTEED